MERLPLAVVTEAIRRYRQQFFDLLRVIALPALGCAVILYVWYGTTEQDKPLVVFLWLAQGFLMTLAALSCHRIILLGSQAVPRLGSSGSSARDWKFIATATALFVVTNLLLQPATLAVFIPLSLITPELTAPGSDSALVIARLAALPVLYVTCRFAICLPAVAIDHRLRVREAWAITRGYGMRLLLLLGVAPWLLHFVQRSLAASFSAHADYVIAGNFLFWLFLPLEITVLSLSYRRLSTR